MSVKLEAPMVEVSIIHKSLPIIAAAVGIAALITAFAAALGYIFGTAVAFGFLAAVELVIALLARNINKRLLSIENKVSTIIKKIP